MENKKLGSQTYVLANPPVILSAGNAVGEKEGQGPLAGTFDHIDPDDTFGQDSWEKAESAMQRRALLQRADKGRTARRSAGPALFRRPAESVYRLLLCRP